MIIVKKLMQQLKDCFEDGDPFINDELLCNPS